jgi:hypothetical protein
MPMAIRPVTDWLAKMFWRFAGDRKSSPMEERLKKTTSARRRMGIPARSRIEATGTRRRGARTGAVVVAAADLTIEASPCE